MRGAGSGWVGVERAMWVQGIGPAPPRLRIEASPFDPARHVSVACAPMAFVRWFLVVPVFVCTSAGTGTAQKSLGVAGWRLTYLCQNDQRNVAAIILRYICRVPPLPSPMASCQTPFCIMSGVPTSRIFGIRPPFTPNPTGGQPTPLSTRGGPPPQKANTDGRHLPPRHCSGVSPCDLWALSRICNSVQAGILPHRRRPSV